jgi:hypothetical protein
VRFTNLTPAYFLGKVTDQSRSAKFKAGNRRHNCNRNRVPNAKRWPWSSPSTIWSLREGNCQRQGNAVIIHYGFPQISLNASAAYSSDADSYQSRDADPTKVLPNKFDLGPPPRKRQMHSSTTSLFSFNPTEVGRCQ